MRIPRRIYRKLYTDDEGAPQVRFMTAGFYYVRSRAWRIRVPEKPVERVSVLDAIWDNACEDGDTQGLSRLAPGVYRLDSLPW